MWVVLDVQPLLIGGDLGVARALSACVHAAAEHNLVLLEHHPETPALYDYAKQGRIRYLSEPQGSAYETVRSIPLIIQEGGGDCAHLSGWRLAELWRDDLRQQGRRIANCKVYCRHFCPDKRCKARVDPDDHYCRNCGKPFLRPSRMFHAEVRRADGDVEDPSRMMGM